MASHLLAVNSIVDAPYHVSNGALLGPSRQLPIYRCGLEAVAIRLCPRARRFYLQPSSGATGVDSDSMSRAL